MKLVIGNKNIEDITKEEMVEVSILEGCCVSLEYWNKPHVVQFDNSLIPNTVYIKTQSTHKNDENRLSNEIDFTLDTKEFHTTYSFRGRNHPCKNLTLESIKFLIKQGYNIPIY